MALYPLRMKCYGNVYFAQNERDGAVLLAALVAGDRDAAKPFLHITQRRTRVSGGRQMRDWLVRFRERQRRLQGHLGTEPSRNG